MGQIAWKDRDAAQRFSIIMLNLFGAVVAGFVLMGGVHRVRTEDSTVLGAAMIAAAVVFAIMVLRRWLK